MVESVLRSTCTNFQGAIRGDVATQIAYEILGSSTGLGVVFTPGGMNDRHFLRDFAEQLLDNAREAGVELRILLWDRRNMGQSRLAFGRCKTKTRSFRFM